MDKNEWCTTKYCTLSVGITTDLNMSHSIRDALPCICKFLYAYGSLILSNLISSFAFCGFS